MQAAAKQNPHFFFKFWHGAHQCKIAYIAFKCPHLWKKKKKMLTSIIGHQMEF